jgi:hypothetical protein
MDERMRVVWRARDTLAIRDQWARIELTLAWMELDQLLTHEVLVFQPRLASKHWKALAVPSKRGVERRLTEIPSNALKIAARGNPPGGFTSLHVQQAKDLVRNGMLPYQQDVQA